jgi:hypothetical protein
MKVGIYVSNFPADTGGGYTFQEDIFLSFLKIRRESSHDFVVLSNHSQRISALSNDDPIHILPSHLKPPARNRLKTLPSRLPILRKRFTSSRPFNAFEAAIGEAQIDLLWPLTPIEVSPVDAPYLFTVKRK